jgi:predicted amidohydrolase
MKTIKRFQVAAVQLNVAHNIPEIVADIKRYIHNARKKGADIICFPESSLWAVPQKNKVILAKIMKFCKESKIWCIVNGNVKEKKHYYNVAIIIDDKGKVFGKHKKVHLGDEYNRIKKGAAFDIYKTTFGNIGVAICWDVSYPDAIQEMAVKGADIVFCPMYWAYDEWAHRKNHKKCEKKILQSLILTRAYDNLVYVVFSNPYNPYDSQSTPYTAIAEPHKIIKEIYDREGMIVVDVDTAYLNKIRKRYKKQYKKFIGK